MGDAGGSVRFELTVGEYGIWCHLNERVTDLCGSAANIAQIIKYTQWFKQTTNPIECNGGIVIGKKANGSEKRE